MGNAESGPSFPERRAGVEKATRGLDTSHNDDWDYDHGIAASNENTSPNSPIEDPPTKLDAPHSKTQSRRELITTDRFHALEQDDDDQVEYEDVSEEEEDDEEEEPVLNVNYFSREKGEHVGEGVNALVETSAAVFHYLETGNSDEDISVAERSSAVFDMLHEEALNGNEKPMRKLLKTAQAVSHVLNKDLSGGLKEDEVSISQQSAAVFQLLEKASSNEAMKLSDRNDGAFQWVNLNNDDDAQSVVSEMSAGIFKALEDTKEKVDKTDVMEFSTAVFDMLQQGATEDDDTRSISELSSAVFKVLDSTPSTDATPNQVTVTVENEKPHSLEVSNFEPISSNTLRGTTSYQSKLVERNIFHKLSRKSHTSDKPEEIGRAHV